MAGGQIDECIHCETCGGPQGRYCPGTGRTVLRMLSKISGEGECYHCRRSVSKVPESSVQLSFPGM